jgi:hypothetical protein
MWKNLSQFVTRMLDRRTFHVWSQKKIYFGNGTHPGMVNLGTPLLGTLLPGTINDLDNYGTFDDPINGPGCHDDLTKPPTG